MERIVEGLLAESMAHRNSGASSGSLYSIGRRLFKDAHTHFPDRAIGDHIRYGVTLVDTLARDEKGAFTHVYLAAERGFDNRVYGRTAPISGSLSGKTIRTGAAAYVPDAATATEDFVEVNKHHRTQSAVALPLLSEGNTVFGALVVEGNEGERGKFGEEVIAPLQRVADLGALAIEYFAQATVDAMTGLYSRRRLNTELVTQYWEAMTRGTPLSIVMMDIDNFKAYNDTYGHLQGDEVLKFVGQTIMAHFPGQFAGRYGGEEYIVLLPKRLEDALNDAELFRRKLERDSARAEKYNGGITASIGVATLEQIDPWLEYFGIELPEPDVRSRAGKLLDIADSAMYVGKGAHVHRWDGTLWVPEELSEKKNRTVYWVTPAAQREFFPDLARQADEHTRMVSRGKGTPRETLFRVHTI